MTAFSDLAHETFRGETGWRQRLWHRGTFRSRLPEGDRKLILRHHRDGWPVRAIAERFGITEEAVVPRQKRARGRLGQLPGRRP